MNILCGFIISIFLIIFAFIVKSEKLGLLLIKIGYGLFLLLLIISIFNIFR